MSELERRARLEVRKETLAAVLARELTQMDPSTPTGT
jgi:hypothetical protein